MITLFIIIWILCGLISTYLFNNDNQFKTYGELLLVLTMAISLGPILVVAILFGELICYLNKKKLPWVK